MTPENLMVTWQSHQGLILAPGSTANPQPTPGEQRPFPTLFSAPLQGLLHGLHLPPQPVLSQPVGNAREGIRESVGTPQKECSDRDGRRRALDISQPGTERQRGVAEATGDSGPNFSVE